MAGVTQTSNFLIVNGMEFPCPMHGLSIISTQPVDSERNANAAVIGQLVGRRQWKINNLQWNGLDADLWARMRVAMEPFFVPVTFTGDDNQRHTIYMYPGDSTAQPLFLSDVFYKQHETCKFNLIDCGW